MKWRTGGLLLFAAWTAAQANAANDDGQYRLNQLLGSDAEYRATWQSLVKRESRLPDWVMNLSGTASPMTAVDDKGDKYLVGSLCDTPHCASQKLYVAFSWDKDEAYALYVHIPEALPADKSPSKHADFRWLGKPDENVKRVLDERLKADPEWY
ncbi:inhibitor of vertebrate lysozyme family protein [Pseudomonas sp. RIT-PI-AD]|uniref:inhibitor of vertebrate lysozyme family protein n=1 Tax=Pseudomonas sp. RIT-PI-AD TaxID=3035294 RepID=UPI0021D7D4A7|nr:inhibitor of vertebrate lysozyme family protein [Pseudomonas sp. RIT-PI-AD]